MESHQNRSALLLILLTTALSSHACGEPTPTGTDTGYPRDIHIPTDVVDMPDIVGTCDLIHPVLGCPCDPSILSCCVPHKGSLKQWRWLYGYQCGLYGQEDTERVWEIYVYPDGDDPCGPGECDPQNYHQCRACPPFWPYFDGVNYRGGPSHEDCIANPRMDGCPCGLEPNCCVMDASEPTRPVGAWFCTKRENPSVSVRSYLWLDAKDFDCENNPFRWECQYCTPCDPSIEPPPEATP